MGVIRDDRCDLFPSFLSRDGLFVVTGRDVHYFVVPLGGKNNGIFRGLGCVIVGVGVKAFFCNYLLGLIVYEQ